MANTVSAQVSSHFAALWGLTQPQTCPSEAEWPPYFGRLLVLISRDATSSTLGWSQDHARFLAPFGLFVQHKYGVSTAGSPAWGLRLEEMFVLSAIGRLCRDSWFCDHALYVMMQKLNSLWSPQQPWVVAADVAGTSSVSREDSSCRCLPA